MQENLTPPLHSRIDKALAVVADNVTVAEWIVEREEVKIADVAELRRQCECLAACDGAVTYVKTSLDRKAQAASCDEGSQQHGRRIRMEN